MCRLGFISLPQEEEIANDIRVPTTYYGRQHSHGVGFAYVENGHIHRERSPMEASRFWLQPEHLNENIRSKSAIFHVRFASVGTRQHCNTHPFVNTKHTMAFVHNGTLFGYEKLKEKLAAQGETFTGDTDSEVLFRCFQRYGENFTKVLNKYNVTGDITLLAMKKDGTIYAYTNSGSLELYKRYGGIVAYSDTTFGREKEAIPVAKNHLYTIKDGKIIKDVKVEKMKEHRYSWEGSSYEDYFSGYGRNFNRYEQKPLYAKLPARFKEDEQEEEKSQEQKDFENDNKHLEDLVAEYAEKVEPRDEEEDNPPYWKKDETYDEFQKRIKRVKV